jgi:phospholipid/cholesterol/gamma-HCH transport system substrate-binding protein
VRRVIRKHRKDFLAIVGLVTLSLFVAGYILNNQRLRFPVLEPKPFTVKAAFSTSQSVTPGQGQTVRVAGIRVGDIAKTELVDGQAIITLQLDDKYRDLVRQDAKALLRPKTGLKDMFVELDPGTKNAPLAGSNFVVPISNTLPDVNPDEILSSLDADTRDYLRLLLKGAGDGLRGRSDDLKDVLKRFEPTYRDLSRVTGTVKARRVELRRLITSLNRLNTELGSKDDDLAQLVDSSSRVFRQLALERRNVSATVHELPSALKQATRTLGKVENVADELGPTTTRMRPVVRALQEANRRTEPFNREAAPQVRDDIRPFVRELRPLVREVSPAVNDLVEGEPGLTRTFTVFNHFFNMLSNNPNGREAPDKAGRDEGFLFHLGWVGHQSNNVFGNADAHGPGRPLTLGGTCTTFRGTVEQQPELEELLGLTGALTDPAVCGGGQGQAAKAKAKK